MSQSFGIYSSGQITPMGGASVAAQYVSLIAVAGFISSGLIVPIAMGQQGCGDVSMVTYDKSSGQLAWTGTNSGSYTVGSSNLAAMAGLYSKSQTTYDPQVIIDAVDQIVSSTHGIVTNYLEQLVDITTMINTLVGSDTEAIIDTINGRCESLSDQLDAQFEGYANEIKNSSTTDSQLVANVTEFYGQFAVKLMVAFNSMNARKQKLAEIEKILNSISIRGTAQSGNFDHFPTPNLKSTSTMTVDVLN